jgi:hypothetical protein
MRRYAHNVEIRAAAGIRSTFCTRHGNRTLPLNAAVHGTPRPAAHRAERQARHTRAPD